MGEGSLLVALTILGLAFVIYGLMKLSIEDRSRACPPHKWEQFFDGLRCLSCGRKPHEVPPHFRGDDIN